MTDEQWDPAKLAEADQHQAEAIDALRKGPLAFCAYTYPADEGAGTASYLRGEGATIDTSEFLVTALSQLWNATIRVTGLPGEALAALMLFGGDTGGGTFLFREMDGPEEDDGG